MEGILVFLLAPDWAKWMWRDNLVRLLVHGLHQNVWIFCIKDQFIMLFHGHWH